MADHDAFTLLGVASNASGATREHSGSHELLNYLSVLAAVCSAAIMAAAFFSSAWWLSLLGMVPFLAQLFYVRSFVERILRWFLFGFFLFGFLNAPLLSFDPIQTGDIRFYAHSALLVRAILIYVGGVFSIACLVGLLTASADSLASRSQQRIMLSVVFIPLAWFLIEKVLQFSFFHFDVESLAFCVTPSHCFRQLVPLVGTSGTAAFLVRVNVLLAISSNEIAHKQATRGILGLLATSVALLCIIIFNARSRRLALPQGPRIVVLQPAQKGEISLPFADNPQFRSMMTSVSHVESGDTIVIFPSHLIYAVFDQHDLTPLFFRFLFGKPSLDNSLILVTVLSVRGANGLHSEVVATKGGYLLAKYRKRFLMPESDFIPRPDRSLVDSRYGPDVLAFRGSDSFLSSKYGVGAINCSERFVLDAAADQYKAGARVFIETGSDGAFDNPIISEWTLRASQSFATYNRVWVVRAMKSGISAVIAPDGDILASLPPDRPGVLYFPIPRS
jgi:apolipoprotein N-acyltransferase